MEIDGAMGEGGGQVLRTSLALSLITQTPLRVVNVRAGRKRPGLRRQHVAAIEAAAQVGGGRVEGFMRITNFTQGQVIGERAATPCSGTGVSS